MINRFKIPMLHKTYNAIMAQAHDTSSKLYINGVRRTLGNYGASHRQSFWNGFDHKKGGHIPLSAGCKTSVNWACFRAGQDFAKEKDR